MLPLLLLPTPPPLPPPPLLLPQWQQLHRSPEPTWLHTAAAGRPAGQSLLRAPTHRREEPEAVGASRRPQRVQRHHPARCLGPPVPHGARTDEQQVRWNRQNMTAADAAGATAYVGRPSRGILHRMQGVGSACETPSSQFPRMCSLFVTGFKAITAQRAHVSSRDRDCTVPSLLPP